MASIADNNNNNTPSVDIDIHTNYSENIVIDANKIHGLVLKLNDVIYYVILKQKYKNVGKQIIHFKQMHLKHMIYQIMVWKKIKINFFVHFHIHI